MSVINLMPNSLISTTAFSRGALLDASITTPESTKSHFWAFA